MEKQYNAIPSVSQHSSLGTLFLSSSHSTSHTVVKMMKQIFGEQGIPRVVRSNNGSYYSLVKHF